MVCIPQFCMCGTELHTFNYWNFPVRVVQCVFGPLRKVGINCYTIYPYVYIACIIVSYSISQTSSESTFSFQKVTHNMQVTKATPFRLEIRAAKINRKYSLYFSSLFFSWKCSWRWWRRKRRGRKIQNLYNFVILCLRRCFLLQKRHLERTSISPSGFLFHIE